VDEHETDPQTDPEARPSAGPEAADVAHELGNRLAAIVAFSHLIRTDPRLPADLHDQADLLVEEAGRTRQLVERLLATVVPRSAPAPTAASPSPDPASTPQPRAAPATSGPRPRILIVDDEPAIRDFLGRTLERIGYEPLLAATGAEALEIVRSDPPDAILCDHRMAGMTGAAFNDAVAETSPDLARRFAFMTGDVTNPDLRALADARGVALLAKPFDMASVQQTLERIVRA
jgi:CheY-like chemotaxis protein